MNLMMQYSAEAGMKEMKKYTFMDSKGIHRTRIVEYVDEFNLKFTAKDVDLNTDEGLNYVSGLALAEISKMYREGASVHLSSGVKGEKVHRLEKVTSEIDLLNFDSWVGTMKKIRADSFALR